MPTTTSFLHNNLRFLRESNELKQSDLDEYLKFKKGAYSTYENSTTPKLPVLLKLVKMYRPIVDSSIELTIEKLYERDLTKEISAFNKKSDETSENEAGPATGLTDIDNTALNANNSIIYESLLSSKSFRQELIEKITRDEILLKKILGNDILKKELAESIVHAMR